MMNYRLRIASLVRAASLLAALSMACASEPRAGLATAPGSATSASGAGTATGAVESATASKAGPQVMFVANTGGTGVSIRARCEDAARLAGPGLKDGTEVTITTVGSDQCAGWAQVDAAGTTSWVHLSYLSPEKPAAVSAVSAPAPRAAAPPSNAPVVAPPAPPPVTAHFEKVLVYREHLIPLSQLTYRSAAFGPILMTPTGPTPGAYICPAYNYSAPTVRTAAGVVLQDPDPEGCGFARADTAVIRDALIQ